MFIYKITNLVNGKCYIGQTIKDITTRFKEHCKPSNKCTILREAIKKYDKDNFKIEVLEKCSSFEELNFLERYYIKHENSISPNGYNIVEGGNKGPTMVGKDNPMFGRCGQNHPSFGKKRTEDFCKRISITSSGENNGMFGIRGKDHPSSIKILCKTTNKVYDAVQDAARDLNLDPSGIVKVLKNKRKHHKKYTFCYVEE